MSYSIREHVEYAERSLEFFKKIAELYPDARQEQGRWFSACVPIAECTMVALQIVQSKNSELPPTIYVLCGKEIADGGIIWSDEQRFGGCFLPQFLEPGKMGDVVRLALLEYAKK